MMTFFLQAELTVNNNGIVEHNRYETLLAVELLKETEKTAVVYDKELRMHFAVPIPVMRVYEIELKKIFLNLAEGKSEDFMRRAMYRYDWVQPKVNPKGEITSIENKKELKDNWQQIENGLKKNYKGSFVDACLEELSLEMATGVPVYPAFSRYFYFGLLFPLLPEEHGAAWERKRIIELSPYEDERLEEQAMYVETADNNRRYAISGSLLPDSQAKLEAFEGYMIAPENELFPVEAEVNAVVKKYGFIHQWNFKLERYL